MRSSTIVDLFSDLSRCIAHLALVLIQVAIAQQETLPAQEPQTLAVPATPAATGTALRQVIAV